MARRGENIRKRKDGRWEGRYIKGRKPDHTAIWGYIYGRTYAAVKKELTIRKNELQACYILVIASSKNPAAASALLQFSHDPKCLTARRAVPSPVSSILNLISVLPYFPVKHDLP